MENEATMKQSSIYKFKDFINHFPENLHSETIQKKTGLNQKTSLF